jgi:pre-60S factor REI1
MKTNNYQCVNCQIHFDIEENYMIHYKSEHHRYNIKRKLIGLPPLTFEEYHLRNLIILY